MSRARKELLSVVALRIPRAWKRRFEFVAAERGVSMQMLLMPFIERAYRQFPEAPTEKLCDGRPSID